MSTASLEETIAGDDVSEVARRDARLERGDPVGRYVVLGQLGSGAMGVVFAAYDPDLDRRVAIKLLLPNTRGEQAQTRLLREAQALARLVHPNVVTVHDVGTLGERVYVAMEFVEGQTMAEWMEQDPRPSWSAVVDVFAQAGAGLAAAHAKKLLHRDFKPDNVMVGDDGRVVVMDFGLARPSDTDAESEAVPAPTGARRNDLLSTDLTRADALVGTPGYMAPECFEGKPANERSDQYSFCVALWEAIHHERPTAGTTLVELAGNVLAGNLRPPGRPAPRWLQRIMERGLSRDPDMRFASLDALLHALAKGRDSGRRRIFAGLGLGAAVVVGGVFVAQHLQRQRVIVACNEAGDEIDEHWSDQARVQLRDAFLATKASYAETTADKALPWLDRQAEAWRSARTEVCRHGRVTQTWEADTVSRAMWCLEERRGELVALVDRLRVVDPKTLRRAIASAAGLRAIEPCLDEAILHARPAPPVDRIEGIREVRSRLHRARAMFVGGEFDRAKEESERALAEAEPIAWPPLSSAARVVLANALVKISDFDQAREHGEQAYFDAAEAGDSELAFDAAMAVMWVHRLQANLETAEHWAELGRVELSRIGDDPIREANLDASLGAVKGEAANSEQELALAQRARELREQVLGPQHPSVAIAVNNLALAHKRAGRFERARELFEQNIALQRELLGEGHPVLAASMNNLANVLREQGEAELALEQHEHALAIRKRALGNAHPYVADSINNIAIHYDLAGDYPRAIELYQQAKDIRIAAYGEEHPRVAASFHNLAIVYRLQGDLAKARVHAMQALEINEKVRGPNHPTLAAGLNILAMILRSEGDAEGALEVHHRALKIRETALGPEHPRVANTLGNIAVVHHGEGRMDEAREFRTRALEIHRKALGPQHLDVAQHLLWLAELELEEKNFEVALSQAEQALQIYEAADASAALIAETQFVIADVLWQSSKDRGRALELAETAAQIEGSDGLRANIEQWLAERRAKVTP
ncbi:MAG: serine/threonine-protein kinase [Myxococcota bacterium]